MAEPRKRAQNPDGIRAGGGGGGGGVRRSCASPQKRVWSQATIQGAFFWDNSGYSYPGLGITEYTEFQFPKERSFIVKTEYS